ncbi:MAG: radical SAM protein, partial [Methanomicrobiales archaeon]|nr:radical SAM protein [Methanomicrobiales archaeon]
MVLFITGRCPRTCWYCPLSSERKGHDVIFANDRKIESPAGILEEARLMSALGTGITGGEPLLVPGRVAEYAALLKKEFGPRHHIHLYTGIAPSMEMLTLLHGLVDEIRLHPPEECWDRFCTSPYAEAARNAKAMGFCTGIEVPALPALRELAPALDLVDFLNINELEWGELSADAMRKRGLRFADSLHNAVKNSHTWAAPLRRHKKVHWCPSAFKDAVQLRERLKRIARNTARSFDQITGDGTIIYGVIEVQQSEREGLDIRAAHEDFEDRIELSCRFLQKECHALPGTKYIIERYPNRGIIV